MTKNIKVKDRSRRAQEAYADYLMKVSSSLFIAFLVAILIVPISAIISGGFAASHNELTIIDFLKPFLSFNWLIFLVLEWCVFWVSDNYRNRALDIYDSLSIDQ